MTGMTDYQADDTLNRLTGRSPSATRYIALFTAVGSDDGTGFTEVSGNGYARAATVGGTSGGTWDAPSGSAPREITNDLLISFPAATGPGWGTVIAWGIYDAATSGNLLFWDYLGTYDWLEFTGTNASPSVLTAPAHGYSNGDQVVVSAEPGGGALPATAGSWAGLKTVAGAATDTFTAGVNTTGTGSGMVRKVDSHAVAAAAVFQFPADTLTIKQW